MGRPAENLVGQVFGRLTVIERDTNSKDGHARWKCQCSCPEHNIVSVASNVLKKGNTKSCGCLNKEVASKQASERYKDLTNLQFGMLIAKEMVGSNNKGSKIWRCECDCGNKEFYTTSHHLTTGNTQSCGCQKSRGELEIRQLLEKNNIKFEREKTFSDFQYETSVHPRFDFYLPDLNRLIEFDGIQHFQESNTIWDSAAPLEVRQERDKIKNKYAIEHNIPLVRIPYTERNKITLEMLLGDKFLVG